MSVDSTEADALACQLRASGRRQGKGKLKLEQQHMVWTGKGDQQQEMSTNEVMFVDVKSKSRIEISAVNDDWVITGDSAVIFEALKRAIGDRLTWTEAGGHRPQHEFERIANDDVSGIGEPNLRLWLTNIGMPQYIQNFENNDVQWNMLSDLSDDDLKSIGVDALGHRKIILRAITVSAAVNVDDEDIIVFGNPRPWFRKPGERKAALLFSLILTLLCVSKLFSIHFILAAVVGILVILLIWLAAAAFHVCAKKLTNFTTVSGAVFALWVAGLVGALLVEIFAGGFPDFPDRVRHLKQVLDPFFDWLRLVVVLMALSLPVGVKAYWRVSWGLAIRASIIAMFVEIVVWFIFIAALKTFILQVMGPML